MVDPCCRWCTLRQGCLSMFVSKPQAQKTSNEEPESIVAAHASALLGGSAQLNAPTSHAITLRLAHTHHLFAAPAWEAMMKWFGALKQAFPSPVNVQGGAAGVATAARAPASAASPLTVPGQPQPLSRPNDVSANNERSESSGSIPQRRSLPRAAMRALADVPPNSASLQHVDPTGGSVVQPQRVRGSDASSAATVKSETMSSQGGGDGASTTRGGTAAKQIRILSAAEHAEALERVQRPTAASLARTRARSMSQRETARRRSMSARKPQKHRGGRSGAAGTPSHSSAHHRVPSTRGPMPQRVRHGWGLGEETNANAQIFDLPDGVERFLPSTSVPTPHSVPRTNLRLAPKADVAATHVEVAAPSIAMYVAADIVHSVGDLSRPATARYPTLVKHLPLLPDPLVRQPCSLLQAWSVACNGTAQPRYTTLVPLPSVGEVLMPV